MYWYIYLWFFFTPQLHASVIQYCYFFHYLIYRTRCCVSFNISIKAQCYELGVDLLFIAGTLLSLSFVFFYIHLGHFTLIYLLGFLPSNFSYFIMHHLLTFFLVYVSSLKCGFSIMDACYSKHCSPG